MSTLKRNFVQWFFQMLMLHLPRRTKRMIFLTSLTALIKNTTSLSNETLHRLNELMGLAYEEKAMLLPAQYCSGIWCGKTFCEVCQKDISQSKSLSTETLYEMVNHVYESMPQWLRYARDIDIQGDIARLLDNREKLLSA